MGEFTVKIQGVDFASDRGNGVAVADGLGESAPRVKPFAKNDVARRFTVSPGRRDRQEQEEKCKRKDYDPGDGPY